MVKQSGLNLTLIAVLLLVVSIGIAGALSYFTGGTVIAPPEGEDSSSSQTEPPAVPNHTPTGGLPGGSKEAIKEGRLPGFEDAEINTDSEVFLYQLNEGVTAAMPEGTANILVENNPGNTMLMQLCYYLEDTQELIYTSPMLSPGEYIDTDTISVKLKKGSYNVNAVLNVYNSETLELNTTFHHTVALTVHQKFLGIF